MNPHFAGYGGSGSGSVSGQLIIIDAFGLTHAGYETQLTLLPVTAYTKEMVDRELGDGEYLAVSDPRFKKYVRKTSADDNGNFSFQQVPAGE